MNKYLTFLLLTFPFFLSYSQSSNLAEKLVDYQLQLVNKISVGSSPDEVKKILGKPYAVEVGFPDSDQIIFRNEFPSEQSGTLNYTTWFYKLSSKKINYTVNADTTFYINSEEVNIEIYDYYIDKDSVYYWPICSINGKRVSYELYKYYLDKDSVYVNQHNMIDFPKENLGAKQMRGVIVNKVSQECESANLIQTFNDILYSKEYLLPVLKASQEMSIEKQHSATDEFLPILCVIFERGTNVVTMSKVYFQWL